MGRYLKNDVHKVFGFFDPLTSQSCNLSVQRLAKKKAWLFAKLQPGRPRKIINAT